jgi:arylsulfatase A-like enzyme
LGIDHLELAGGKMHSVWYYDDYSRDMEKAGYLNDYRDRIWDRSLQRVFAFPGAVEYHPDYWTGDKACSFIEQAEDDPLFAWVSFNGPHYPFDAPATYLERVDKAKLWQRNTRSGELLDRKRIHHHNYYGPGTIDGASQAPGKACMNFTEEYWERLRVSYNANVSLIDEKVGEILAAVEKRYGDNTLIIFTADHGEMLGNHGLWGKHDCAYDEVWRVPLFIKYPGDASVEQCKEPRRMNDLVNVLDILPTCLDAAGLEAVPCDGLSLFCGGNSINREYTFSECEGFIAVTDGRHKYIHIQRKNENYRELLDMVADPGEFTNFINEPLYAGVLNTLREKTIEHFMPKVLP